MLKLKQNITLDAAAIGASNLADRFEADDRKAIGNWVKAGYTQDKFSRHKWEKRTEAAMDLAMQIQKQKTFPWPGCANIAFPLVTIAVLQFHAIAYPAIISGTDVVKCRVIGEDPDGEKKARSDRISCHMSYQVLEEDKTWEEEEDRTLINVAVVGSAFKKSYYSFSRKHNVSELVMAKDLVLDYYAKSVEECPRKTHIIPLYRNDIYERVQRKTFVDVLGEAWYQGVPAPATNTQTIKADNRSGQTPPPPDETTPFTGLEQHCSLDLDGDGYAEPYIITIEESSATVLRIITRFDRIEDIEKAADGSVIRINALEYFTKRSFIPSPDGGIYDMGFGVLLGPLNESVNSIINQLVDAGTMQTTGGGFLGRGAKIRGGVYTFSPLEWKRVDSTGDDLRKDIVPLEVREPSAVLFQLLGLLINYTNRISGATDASVGENPGQNTPAETARSMIEQGQKIYKAIFKRIWRSMKEEFKKLYVLNGINLPVRQTFATGQYVLREDYLGDPEAVVPAADPNITSDAEAFQQIQMVKASAQTTGGYNKDELERAFLKAIKLGNIDTIFPGSDKVPQGEDVRITIQKLKNQERELGNRIKQQQFVATLLEQQRVNNAKIMELTAKAALEKEQAAAVGTGHEIAAAEAAIGALRAHNEAIGQHIDMIMKGLEHERESRALDIEEQSVANDARLSGLAGASGNGSAAKSNGAAT